MIKLSGSVSIKEITGRNGPFVVGRLTTEIGEFAVKRGIEEFDAGLYEGEFTISRIYPASYAVAGRWIIEVRADIEAIALSDIDTNTDVGEAPSLQMEAEEPESAETEEDSALFGDLWPLGARVKLDPTVEREVLRRQACRLKELGYQFRPIGRVFEIPQVDPTQA